MKSKYVAYVKMRLQAALMTSVIKAGSVKPVKINAPSIACRAR
jgi:hypothetical protein